MILYDLICDNDHEFESWFKSSSAYDTLRKGNNISCPMCGTEKVRKAPMAPRISKSGRGESEVESSTSAPAPASASGSASAPTADTTPAPPAETSEDMAQVMNKAVEAIKELQETIEKKFENVGEKFPEEARKIHYGETEARGIYGEASAEEAQELIEEGVEIAAVPWQKRKTS